MKKKQVVKLFSVGMACILAMSPCSTAGSIAYASEMQGENKTEDSVSDDSGSKEGEGAEAPETKESESAEAPATKESENDPETEKNESDEETPETKKDEDKVEPSETDKDNDEADPSETDEEEDEADPSGTEEDEDEADSSETKDKDEIETPSENDELENEEDASVDPQEPSQEIEDEETTEVETEEEIIEEEVNSFSARVEEVELTAYKEDGITFSTDSTWDEGGENIWKDLTIQDVEVLKSGDTVSLDLYIPQENENYSGLIKVQGIAKIGDDWEWESCAMIPELKASDFEQEVEIQGERYKKASISFTLEEKQNNPKGFTIKIVGYQCDYSGMIYFANVKTEIGSGTDADDTEQVSLQTFYGGAEISFDELSDWSEFFASSEKNSNEHQLGLNSAQPLKSGATVSFDMYIPADRADYSGLIKVQGIARLGSNWDWTENKVIPEFDASGLTEEVTIDDKAYKKVKVSFTFGDEITADYLAEFTVKIVGYQCSYAGPIYYDNVKLEDGTSQSEPTEEAVLKTWDFADGIDGWKYDGVWDNKGTNSVEWGENYKALAMNVDYSQDAGVSWSEIKVSYNDDTFEAAGANTIKFDFIYNPSSMTKGSFKIKLFANSGIDVNAAVNTDAAEDYADSLKVVHFTMRFDDTDIKQGMTIGVIGSETDYQGVIYLDNIELLREAKQPETDIYVDATEEVTGQNMQLSVQGNTLNTGAGSSGIATAIKLADGNADASAKQVYAYLQAVGNTDSVIFGQQNNTSHKAGSSSLSCSDTMDVVGSYAGVIGLDGLALTGNEYSADRYLDEMGSLDSAYSTVSGQINAASTQAEKNVIAAAALTNYNIRNGAIATLSLHMPNFSVVSKTGAAGGPSYAVYDFTGYTPNTLTGDVMNQILPGGAYNDAFTAYLDMVADYAHHVDGAVLFRPFHENTGSWFWWGAAFCDEQTYKSVFKYTVEYLRDEKNVHNFLYVYGPGSEASSVDEYAARYPGDGYVDMVGFDMYHSNPTEGDTFITNFTNELNIVERFANEHGKLVAVTETGTARDAADGDNQTALLKTGNERRDWYREILDVVKQSSASYYLVWANFSEKDGFYTPYVKSVNDGTKHGHEMMDDFIRFFNENNSVFAVNQRQALNDMKSVSVQASAVINQSGYIVVPVSGSRVLDTTTLRAKVTGVSVSDQVTFVCRGSEGARTLEAQIADGYATAVLSQSDLQSLGEAVGEISLIINGTTYDTVRAMFNIGEPEIDPYEIDGFENYYGVDDMLTKSWAPNKASGSSITLSLSKDYSYEGDYVMKFAYTETSDGWAGATISKEVDWTDCDALKFWTVPDGKLQKTVIQITAGGNTYEYYLNENPDYAAAGVTPVLVTIPFDKFVARDIAGNPAGGLVNDRGDITSVGLWVNAIAGSEAIVDGMVSGVLYYDSITAVASGSGEVLVQRADSKPVEPEQPSAPSSSSSSSNSASAPAQTAVVRVVEPSYTTKDNRKVSGWQEVVDAAYLDAQPVADSPDVLMQNRIVDINITGVTDLVIPQATVVSMQQRDANYNFYYQNIAITITHEMLATWTGALDLEVVLKAEENFGSGFDAFYITKHANEAIPESAIINILLSAEKAGSYAHVFGRNGQTEYELLSSVPISELGTIAILAGVYEEYVILY